LVLYVELAITHSELSILGQDVSGRDALQV
jgi:hypothetical protein